MKDILIFLFGTIAGKLIEDNLPSLHYKNLVAGFEKHILPGLLTAYLGHLYLLTKITCSPQIQKNYTNTLTTVALAIFLAKAVENKKQTAA